MEFAYIAVICNKFNTGRWVAKAGIAVYIHYHETSLYLMPRKPVFENQSYRFSNFVSEPNNQKPSRSVLKNYL